MAAIVATKAIDLCFELSNSLTSVVILRVAKGDRALMYLGSLIGVYGLKSVTDRLHCHNRTDTVHNGRNVNQPNQLANVREMQWTK